MNVHHLPDQTDIQREEAGPLTTRQQMTLSVLWFALNFQSAALLVIVLPLQIVPFVSSSKVGDAQQAAILGWLSALGGLISLFIPPLAGALSDRTTGSLGRRRPYIILGTIVAILGAWVLATPHNLVFLLIGLLLFEIGNNVCTAGYQGMLPDLVPEAQRGEASGYMGLMTILGNAASFGLAAVLLGSLSSAALSVSAIHTGAALYYVFTALVLGIGAFITVVWVHETPYEELALAGAGPARSASDTVRERLRSWFALWTTPWQQRNFTLVFLTRTLVMLGISFFMTFIEYYFANVAQVPNFVQEAAALAVLALGGATTSAFILGILSDRLRARIGRVPLVCAATICMSLASLAFVVLPPGAPLWPMGLLFGVGLGAYYSVDWALAIDVLPSPDAFGKDMGIWSIATTLPAIIAPFIGAVILNIAGYFGQTTLGYRLVFVIAVALLLAGAVCILLVRNEFRTPNLPTPPIPPAAKPLSSTDITDVAPPAAPHNEYHEHPEHPERHVRFGWRLALQTRAGHARGFLLFWPFWEWVNRVVHPEQPIPAAPYDLLQVQFIRFKGRPITLPDGTAIRRGDHIVELHIHNAGMSQAAAQSSSWQLLRMLMGDLRALARWTHAPDFPSDVHAFYGYTLLSRAAPRLGFTLRTRPKSLRAWLDGLFMMGLLVLYNPRGRQRLNQGTTYGTEPVEVWMSRDELRRRYDRSA
jgi:MFS family permease